MSLLTSHIYPYRVDGMACVVFFEMCRFKALGAIRVALIRGKMWIRAAYLRNSFGPMIVPNEWRVWAVDSLPTPSLH